MSMELHVLSDRRLNSVTEWQRAIDSAGFPLSLAEGIDLLRARGLLPAKLNDERTGFECYHDDAWETVRFIGASNFDHIWKYALGLRWLGSQMNELYSAWMAATAYAEATDGIIFDYEEGKVFTSQQARELVGRLVHDAPHIKALLEDITREFSKKR